MVFNSIQFLVFLPIVFLLYWTKQLPDTTASADSTELRLNYRDNVKLYSEFAAIMRSHHKRLILLALPIYTTARERVN